MLVFMATRPITLPLPTASAEPALNPNQPNQRMKTPSDASGISAPGWPVPSRPR